MFEILVKRESAERHPIEMFFVGFVYSSLAIPFGYYIFRSHASLVIVFLTVLASIHLVHGVISIEEKKDRLMKSEKSIMREHTKAFLFFIFLFLGFVFSFSFWGIILPSEVSAVVFEVQKGVISSINSISGNAALSGDLGIILRNNFRVLMLSFIFSLVYGAGVTFILAWNSSVIGFAIGSLARSELGLVSLPVAFGRYLTHGIVEILAYFCIALAGGILSIAIAKRHFKKTSRRVIFADVFALIVLSMVMIIVAGVIEVYVTPFL